MSLTNPKDFKTLYSLIPHEKRDKVWCFPIRSGKKNPEVPAGTVLKGNLSYRLSYAEALTRLQWGSNVGIYAISGGLMFLDLDVSGKKLLASRGFLDALESKNTTLKIKTRNGGFQYYFWNEGIFPNQVLKENGVQIGELRTDWYYVVGVGSYVAPDENSIGDDGTYRIIREEPISQFCPFGDYFKKNDEIRKDDVKTFVKKTETKDSISLEIYKQRLEDQGKVRRKMTTTERKYLVLERSL